MFNIPCGGLITSNLENRVLFKQMLGGMAKVAHFIAGNEQTQLKQVNYFLFFGVFLVAKPYFPILHMFHITLTQLQSLLVEKR